MPPGRGHKLTGNTDLVVLACLVGILRS